jgi:hypothetical protein
VFTGTNGTEMSADNRYKKVGKLSTNYYDFVESNGILQKLSKHSHVQLESFKENA